jgi:hypothetical protein
MDTGSASTSGFSVGEQSLLAAQTEAENLGALLQQMQRVSAGEFAPTAEPAFMFPGPSNESRVGFGPWSRTKSAI